MHVESICAITFDLSERSMSKSLRFRRLISCKGAKVGHVLLLNTNRKSHIVSPNSIITLGLECPCALERSKSRSSDSWRLICRKRTKICLMLLVNLNRKLYMGSLMILSRLTLGDFERSISSSPRLWKLISRKGAGLGHMLLIKH